MKWLRIFLLGLRGVGETYWALRVHSQDYVDPPECKQSNHIANVRSDRGNTKVEDQVSTQHFEDYHSKREAGFPLQEVA